MVGRESEKFLSQRDDPVEIGTCYPTAVLNGLISLGILSPEQAYQVKEYILADPDRFFTYRTLRCSSPAKMSYILYVIPDKRSAIRDPSIQSKEFRMLTEKLQLWIPAFAEMTSKISTYNSLSLMPMGQIP